MRDLFVILLIVLVAISLAAFPSMVRGGASPDPNCALISQEGTLKTYYCYNPENGKSYYRNNLGFMMLDEEVQ